MLVHVVNVEALALSGWPGKEKCYRPRKEGFLLKPTGEVAKIYSSDTRHKLWGAIGYIQKYMMCPIQSHAFIDHADTQPYSYATS